MENHNTGFEEAGNSLHETQALQALTPADQKFYRQTLYVAAIERYFGFRGLVCCTEMKHESGYDFAFRHVKTDMTILVFSRLDDEVLEVIDKTPYSPYVIIDVGGRESVFVPCEACAGRHHLTDNECYFEHDAIFFVLSNDVLFERDWDISNDSCEDYGWKPVRPRDLEIMARHLEKAEEEIRNDGRRV